LEESIRRRDIRARTEALGINNAYFTRLIDQIFYQTYPNLLTSGPNGGRKSITAAPEDEPLRIRWDNIALRVLDTLGTGFSESSLQALGSYSEESRGRWRSTISAANVGERSLNDLVDAKFFSRFPEQAGKDFLTQPVGQLYYAIAEDRAQAIESGAVIEEVRFASGNFSQDVSGQLGIGEGRIYKLTLTSGQLLRLNLEAPSDSTQLSLYLPNATDDNPAVFADSEQTTWSGALTQTGLYELVVINRSSEPIDYRLSLSVDNVTSAPVAPPRQETGSGNGSGNGANGNDSSTNSNSVNPASGSSAGQGTLPPISPSNSGQTGTTGSNGGN
jgi:serine/threonine protein kinase, bacterial